LAQAIFLRGARQLLTLRGPSVPRTGSALGNLEIIEDGSLLIRDGVIVQVGSTRRLENLREARQAVELAVNGAVVMPGFVDASMAVQASVAPNGRVTATPFFETCSALLRSSVQHGTLHAQLRVSAGSSDLRANFSALRQILSLGSRMHGLTRCWSMAEETTLSNSVEAIAQLAERKLAHRIDVPATSRTQALYAAAHSERLGINLLYQSGCREDLRDTLASARPRTVICEEALHDNECSVLAEFGLPVVVAPIRCLINDIYCGSVRRLIQWGGALALGSGYESRESPVFNMQMAISLAVLRLGLSAEEAIAAATVNAAYAAGVGHLTGTLEVGKRADLLILDLPDYRELPRQFGSNHVLLALREGKLAVNRSGHKVILV